MVFPEQIERKLPAEEAHPPLFAFEALFHAVDQECIDETVDAPLQIFHFGEELRHPIEVAPNLLLGGIRRGKELLSFDR